MDTHDTDRDVLPHERLEVYRVALEFAGEVEKLLSGMTRRGFADGDQLDRACGSILLNIAEGAGEFRPAEKARIYRIALRSALECGAALDRLAKKNKLTSPRLRELKRFVARLTGMLTKLVMRFGASA